MSSDISEIIHLFQPLFLFNTFLHRRKCDLLKQADELSLQTTPCLVVVWLILSVSLCCYSWSSFNRGMGNGVKEEREGSGSSILEEEAAKSGHDDCIVNLLHFIFYGSVFLLLRLGNMP